MEALSTDDAPIVVYSSYEAQVIRNMAVRSPELAGELGRLEARLCDLLPVVRRSVYHPGFECGFSLKMVGPALAPHANRE